MADSRWQMGDSNLQSAICNLQSGNSNSPYNPPMRRVTRVTGVVIGVGAAIGAVAWMLRDRIAKPQPAPAPPAARFRVSPPPTAERTDGDDLAAIRGIGPVFKARLAAAGISRFDELAAASPDRLADIAGVPEPRAREWVDQARTLA